MLTPVFQDRFAYGEGNCVWACVASLFGIPLEELRFPPPSNGELTSWTESALPSMELHTLDLCENYRMRPVEDLGDRWTYDLRTDWEPPAVEYWCASVHSQRLKTPPESEWYPMPALHMVVMQGRKMVHDPNPNNPIDYTPVVVAQTWWTDKVDGEGLEPTASEASTRHSTN